VSTSLLAAALAGAGGVAAGLSAPHVIRRLRDPPMQALGQPRPLLSNVAAMPHLAPALAVLGAAVGAAVGWGVGWTPALAAWTYLVALCLVLGYVDARTRLLLTQLIAPSYAVVGVLLAGAAVADGDLGGIWRALLGWLVMGGCYLLLWVVAPRSLGYGDVRLSGLLALCLGYLGWGQLVAGLYAGFLLGGLVSLLLVAARRASRTTHIPFGPFMMLGAVVGVLWGPSLSHWYTSR